ncbi:MAG TPA: MFS transporter [Polyangiaceae bacterium]|nr:MFS transporter [Polyangiaceae bacterium]
MSTTSVDRRYGALALIVIAQFMVVLDVSIVNVALDALKRSLHFSEGGLQWVITSYAIVFGGFLLLGGRIADLYGRRRLFTIGVGVFTAGSALCALAWSSGSLIAFRGLEGLGGALFAPAGLSLLMTAFPEGAGRARAIAFWGAASGSGGATGVLLGGVLVSYLGWPWIFLINVPVGIAVMALASRYLTEAKRLDLARHFDVAGAIAVTSSLMLFVYALTSGSEHGWSSGLTSVSLAASAALLTLFVGIERRAASPLMPLGIFRVRSLAAGNAVVVVVSSIAFSNFFLLALYLQQVLGYSAAQNGLAFLAVAGTVAIVSNVAGPFVRRVGAQPVLALGVSLLLLSEGWLLRLPVHGHYGVDLLPAFVVMGFGMAFSFVAGTIAALAGVSPADAGIASGITNTARQIGGALGLAVVTTIASVRSGESEAVLSHDFHQAFVVLFATLFAALGITVFLLGPRRSPVAEADEIVEVEEHPVLAEAA